MICLELPNLVSYGNRAANCQSAYRQDDILGGISSICIKHSQQFHIGPNRLDNFSIQSGSR